MKNSVKNYFTFSRADRRGIVALSVVLLLLLAAPSLLPLFLHTQPTNFEAFEAQIESFRQNLSQRQADAKQEWEESRKKYRRHTSFSEGGYIDREYDNKRARKPYTPAAALDTPFAFNPNELTYQQGIKLGLSPKISHTIVNFLEKKGKFRHKEDLKKIYGMTDSDYSRLEPYIQLPSKSDANKAKTYPDSNSPDSTLYETASMRVELKDSNNAKEMPNKEKYKDGAKDDKNNGKFAQNKNYKDPNVKIDINTADTTEWQKLRGIGSTRAKMIVKYRESLGGFANIEQVGETYGLQELFPDIKNNLLNQYGNQVKKININTATYEQLEKHPYINGKQAGVIVKYRKQHGKFTQIADLQKTDLINAETLNKLSPYLILSD
jgi:competence protein ComEA